MIDTVTDDVLAMYDRYLTAWNARDFAGVADCFGEPAQFVLPATSISLPDRNATIAMLEQLFDRMIADGFSHATIGAVTVRQCADGLAIMDARDVKRLRQDGSALEVIDAHYIVRREPDGWRIAVAVVCDPGWRD